MSQPQRYLRAFVSDCEGPLSKNDNAFEITTHFLPNGAYFFSLVSKYDDIQADVVKRPEYKAGDTLKLIAPFLKAFELTNKKIEEYSAKNLILIHGVREMLHTVRKRTPSFIVSTSYEQYLSAFCSLIDFPQSNVYCTKLDLDKYSIDAVEIEELKQLEEKITSLPMIEIPTGSTSLDQFSSKDQETIHQLDKIFWTEIPHMIVGTMLKEITPMGGIKKAYAVRDVAKRVNCDLREIMYVGDSITDAEAFETIKKEGGLTISFNGNKYAIRRAEVAVLSKNTMVIALLADLFSNVGKEGVLNLVTEWNYQSLEQYCSDKTLIKTVTHQPQKTLPHVELVSNRNMDRLSELSECYRKTVRGEAIGRLG